jgi:hypothetical protein
VPLQVIGLIPPGKLVGTWNARPERKLFPPARLDGTLVIQVPLKVVVAGVQLGQKVTVASGTVSVYGPPGALKVIVWLVKLIVAVCVELSPPTLRTESNQM